MVSSNVLNWSMRNEADIKSVKYSAAMMWSTLQMGIAITCACLPTLGPVLPSISKQFTHVRNWSATLWSRSRTAKDSLGHGYKISNDNVEFSAMASNPPSVPQPTYILASQGYSQSWAQSDGHSFANHDVERVPSKTVLIERDVRVSYKNDTP